MRIRRRESSPPRAARPGERIIDATDTRRVDPPDPWERPLDRRLLPSLQGEGMRGHPYRPVTLRDVPPAAVEDLGVAIGEVEAGRLFVLPSSRRTVDRGGNAWVTTPARVIGMGADAIALWVDDGARPGTRARIPFDDVLAVMDLSVLLLGRLEVTGEGASFIVRYNAVNRPDLRDMLLPLRRSFKTSPVPPSEDASSERDLPLKWLNVVQSPEAQPSGRGDIALVAGGIQPPPRPRGGVALLTTRELVVATDPTPDSKEARYGVDLVAVPRARIGSIANHGDLLEVGIAADTHPTLRLSVHAELGRQVATAFGPALYRPGAGLR